MNNEMTTEYMSNEEVIEVLKGIVFNSFDRTTRKERQALDLAIKALEFTESQRICCDNCVNRNIKSKEVCTSPFGECKFFNCGSDMKGGAE